MSILQKITRSGLSALLQDEKTVRGCAIVSFDSVTAMKLNKYLDKSRQIPNPHFGRIQKHTNGKLGLLFSDKVSNGYENMVNRRKETIGQEADFVVGERAWGDKLPNTPFMQWTPKGTGVLTDYLCMIYHESPVTLAAKVAEMGIELNENDAALLELMKQKVVGMESRSGRSEYVFTKEDGTTETIKWDDIQGKGPERNEGKQGGLTEDMKVSPRSFKLSSIVRLAMGGKNYLIEDL